METNKPLPVRMLGGGMNRIIHRKKEQILWGIDLDSVIHQRGHIAIKENQTAEEAYQGVLEKIYTMRGAIFKYLGVDRGRIVELYALSPKKTFRNNLSELYKAKRPTEKEIITELKMMVISRLNNRVLMGDIIEADDFITSLSREKGVIVSAIDKDVIMSASSPVQDYSEWKYENQFQDSRAVDGIERWFCYQSMIGDSVDGITGAKGVGKKKAMELLTRTRGKPYLHQWSSMFETETEAILNMRLVRTDQFDMHKGEVSLWNKNMWKN